MIISNLSPAHLQIDPRALPVGGAGEFTFASGLEEVQYKLCICYPSGLVFQIAGGGNASCGDQRRWDFNPCQFERNG